MTPLLLALSVGLLFLAGYGPTMLLLPRRENFSRLVAVPPVGLACYIVASHCLAAAGLTGKWISIICAAVFLLLLLVSLRLRRLSRQEAREAGVPLLISFAGLLLAAWPLVYEGCHSYIAFGNPDAAFSLAVFEDMLDHPYGQAPPGSFPFWPNAQFAHIFGAGYLAVFLSLATQVSVLNLHEVLSASLVFIAPLSVYLFCLAGLKTSGDRAKAATCVCAASSLVSYTFYLQSLGAITLIALAPAVLAFWLLALETGRPHWILLTGLSFTGTCFGYYAALPMLALLSGSATLVALARRTTRFSTVAVAAGVATFLLAASYPRLAAAIVQRSIFEATSRRLQTGLAGPEILLSFAFALTEDVLPFFWGLSIPPLAWDSAFAPPGVVFFLVLALSVTLFACLLFMLAWAGSGIPLQVRVPIALLLGSGLYLLVQRNAYGVFKLVAWVNPLVLSCFLVGLLTVAQRAAKPAFARPCLYALAALLLGINVVWTVRLGVSSLGGTLSSRGGMVGLTSQDLGQLRTIARLADRDSRILVVLPDPVAQRWAVTYLRRWKLSVVPYLSLSPDEPDAYEVGAAANAESAVYILTWAGRQADIAVLHNAQPVWTSGKFQLLRVADTHNLIACGRGWYRSEGDPRLSGGWQRRFRWLRSNGEIILINPTTELLRLRLTMVSGHGRAVPEREVTLLVNGKEVDRLALSGMGVLISKPFRCQGFLNRLTIALPDNAEPVPRPLGLINAWVPKDARRLNIAVSSIELLTEHEYQRLPLPCSLDLTQPESRDAALLTGVYADRWIAGQARLTLRACGRAEAITIQGFVPGVSAPFFPLELSVWVNGMPLDPLELATPGTFAATLRLPRSLASSDLYEIRIRPTKTFTGRGDRRSLSVMLDRVAVGPWPDASAQRSP